MSEFQPTLNTESIPTPIDLEAEIQMPVVEPHSFMGDEEFKAGIARVKEARAQAVPRPHESEVVVLGALRPDRRLSNKDRDLHRRIIKEARTRLGI